MIGRSAAFLEALRLIQRIARFDATVLIEGETGTGKELAARAIHYQGARQHEPFIAVNCGAVPDQLVENEFLGHERGAFTDARASAPGLLSLANRGTLFLDEIDALSAKAQVLLLRALQERRFRPLGARDEVEVDVRVIAASNKSLQSLVARGQFREDLLFRINLLYLELPPLRVRAGDPTLLAREFTARFCERYDRPLLRISPATLSWLETYAWPGNVRELENAVHRQILLGDGPLLELAPVGGSAPPAAPAWPASKAYSDAKAQAIGEFHRRYLDWLMRESNGNVSEAARQCGKERRALGRLLKRYGVSAGSFRG